MNERPTAPAHLPPAGITGLEPGWSRLVHVPATDERGRTWHILDSWATRTENAAPALTLLCVHGNPSWSFLWRDLLAQVSSHDGDRVRVIAVDQLEMGFSERTGQKRNLSIRVDDLCQLTDELKVAGPVITVAHDWGGPISLGWALRHLDSSPAQLVGVVLTNTAVHQPARSPAPAVIRLIRHPLILRNSTVNTRAFIQGAIEMSRPRLSVDVRAGFYAPYLKSAQRSAIADFVADIPLSSDHESAATLHAITTGLQTLSDIPALLLWGPRDKVFSDLYLHDLEQRLPHADVHRFPKAAHFVGEDADVAGAIVAWLARFDQRAAAAHADAVADTQAAKLPTPSRALADFSVATPATDAVVEIAPVKRSITFAELSQRTEQLAAGMAVYGIKSGDRVAVMVTPGIDLSLAVYACWRLGATLVLVDSGLGRAGMQGALQSANPRYLIGIDKALMAARVLRWPGIRIAVGTRTAALTRLLGHVTDIQALAALGLDQKAPPLPTPDTLAAIAFTSGSTGPSKGVIYKHHHIQAQRDALMSVYNITAKDKLVAAFAPFALYGPTMGITSIVPDMDVTAPGTLDASSLADAVALIDATLVFASPAALVNIVKTGSSLTSAQQAACTAVRSVISAGAPVRAELLKAATGIFNSAELHTPYGMTEVLPVANISLTELQMLDSQEASSQLHSGGVCVGYPLASVTVHIDPLNKLGEASGQPTANAGTMGEILVQAAHTRDSYDRLWLTHHHASQPAGWHRTGDVGELDATGRLWVGGRLGHVITTADTVLTPVDSEQRIEKIKTISMAALVGVGPAGLQMVVAVLQLDSSRADSPSGNTASPALIDQVRQAVAQDIDIAAVLLVKQLPVDRRHNSKVDRAAVAQWAGKVLAGDRVSSL